MGMDGVVVTSPVCFVKTHPEAQSLGSPVGATVRLVLKLEDFIFDMWLAPEVGKNWSVRAT